MRKIKLINGEYYHIFNRGVEKRIIFPEQRDVERFFQGMNEFNTTEPIGSIYQNTFRRKRLGDLVSKSDKLVEFICYCLNPNHYHFILKQLTDRGIEKFMHRIGVGYTMYFNQRHKRSGSLFQGTFKAVHIDSNEYLLHLSVYVSLNNKIHQLGDLVSKSSWGEYMWNNKNKNDFCEKKIILDQFKNISDYKKFAKNSLEYIKKRKEMQKLLLE